MLRLVQFELKKMLLRPLCIIAFITIITINGISLFLTSNGAIIERQEIELQKIEQTKYAGEINRPWINTIQTKLQTITENPDNLVPEAEKKLIQKEYLDRGYTQEYVDRMGSSAFLKPELINRLSYRILIDAEHSSNFYNSAQQFALNERQYYQTAFDGKKGEALAQKSEEMYGSLATNYTLFYDYNLGWIKLNSMQRLMPFTLGLFLLIAMSPVFSIEYSQKTDNLILSSKYGKSKLIYAKTIAAFLLAVVSWLIVQIMNLIIISWLFGLQGGRTFVQDWVYNRSPFPLTQLTNYFGVTFLSLIGVLFFAAIITIVSAKSKTPFISLLVSGVILLFPVMGDISNVGGFLKYLWPYMPSQLLMAVNHFRFFQGYYIFGNVLLMQYVVPATALTIIALIIPIANRTFKRRQVAN